MIMKIKNQIKRDYQVAKLPHNSKYIRYNLSLKDKENKVVIDKYSDYKRQGGKKTITRYLAELCLLTETPNEALRIREEKNIRNAIHELNRVGVNLNQLVKEIKLHKLSPELLTDCTSCLKNLKYVLIKFQGLKP